MKVKLNVLTGKFVYDDTETDGKVKSINFDSFIAFTNSTGFDFVKNANKTTYSAIEVINIPEAIYGEFKDYLVARYRVLREVKYFNNKMKKLKSLDLLIHTK